ncbi:hypothetical protein KO317_00985 [Candidatus Micrarchaeota archaeon]|jgi:dTMP kinase|nr:hypothetical protein [Candidatus Micrarchaeota archaeon]
MTLIVFEGIDGTGKTTQMKRFFQELIEAELPIHHRKYPKPNQNSPIYRHLKEKAKHSPEEMMNFYLQEMEDDLPLLIEENKEGIIMLSRYFYSTISYQGQNLGIETVINEIKRRNLLIPDYVVWFDVDPKISMKRRAEASDPHIFEKNIIMQENCRRIYDKLYETKPFGSSWIKIDVFNKSIEEIWQEIRDQVLEPVLRKSKTL